MADDTTGNATENGAEQTAKETPQGSPEKTVPYARFKEVVDARKAAEESLAAVVEEMIATLPEDMVDLVPNLPPAEKIRWINAAKAKGLFTPPAPANSPDAKRPSGKPAQDISDMSPMQKMQAGYAK